MQIKYFFLLFIFAMIFGLPVSEKHNQRIIVLDPFGDVRHTGRCIGDGFERGLTLQCAEKIKSLIEKRDPYTTVIITRMPGDTVYELQNATLANRNNVDLFINLNFYYTEDAKPTIYIYQFSYGNDFMRCQQGLIVHSYDQAYRINKDTTDMITQLFVKELADQKYQTLFVIKGSFSLPIKPLIGVVAPSITLDLGVKGKELWHDYCEPLVNAIFVALNHCEGNN
ncbi:MAG TPA: hypothetical protein VLB80_04890 [Candidatus Babeliales bacterium]|nr:hypothetical protein [Candidatus Babeliales bacterium]